jgi:Cdc6-like AAA superfamily ATPase
MSISISKRQQKMLERERRLREAFTPASPVQQYSLFAGRAEQIRAIVDAVGQKGQHVVLYGERGVGKTSLANVLRDILAPFASILFSGKDFWVVKVTCESQDNYISIWRKVFGQIKVMERTQEVGFKGHVSEHEVSLELPVDEHVSPEHIREVLQNLPYHTVAIADEFDRVRDSAAKARMADTIKCFSDNAASVTMIMVGVADSVNELLEEHRSVERVLIQVQMPRMSLAELVDILRKGFTQARIRIEQQAMQQIAALSRGLPHYTHLLGLHSALSAVQTHRGTVTLSDVQEGVKRATGAVQHSLLTDYTKAVSSPRKESLYAQVLLACAVAQTDELGYFAAADVREPMTNIMGKRYEIPAFSGHLSAFCQPHRGRVLQRSGTRRRFRFRFANPLLQPYVVLKGLEAGMIDWRSCLHN